MNKPYRVEGGGEKLTVTGELPSTYPEFDPMIYSLETFVPFLDLHQKGYWLPLSKGDTSQEAINRRKELERRDPEHIPWYVQLIWQPLVAPVFHLISDTWKPVVVHVWMWLEIIVGWIFSTVFLAGVVGLMHELHPHKEE